MIRVILLYFQLLKLNLFKPQIKGAISRKMLKVAWCAGKHREVKGKDLQ